MSLRRPHGWDARSAMLLRTLLLGSLLLVSLLISTSCALATNNRLRRSGVEAPATVTRVESTSILVDDEPVLEIGLRIEDETGSSNAVARQVIPTAQLGGIQPGRLVTVRHDPAKPGKAVIVGLGRAPDEGEAHRILMEAQAMRERLNAPGVGRPAEGVVMSVEELGITVNRVANVFELRVMVVPEASAVGPAPKPRAEPDTPFESGPVFENDDLSDADPFGGPHSADEVEPVGLETPFDTDVPRQTDDPFTATAPSHESIAPYEAVVVAAIAKGREDRYGPGRRVRLLYDPADPSRVVFDASRTPSCFSADTGQVECEDGGSVDASPSIASHSLDEPDVDDLLKKGQSMRRAGISLAILGGAGTIAGWTVYGVSFHTRGQAGGLDPDDPDTMAEHDRLTSRANLQLRAALGTIVGSSVLTVTGILLARAGNNRLRRARMSRGEVGFHPAPGGFALRF